MARFGWAVLGGFLGALAGSLLGLVVAALWNVANCTPAPVETACSRLQPGHTTVLGLVFGLLAGVVTGAAIPKDDEPPTPSS